jgi:hypothetical protein
VDDSNIPSAIPKSPEEVALLEVAISQLLGRVTEKWQSCDLNDLTSLEQRAQFLLIAAGMIERRMEMKVECLIASFSAEFELVATGEYGIADALDPLIHQMWTAVSEVWITSHGKGATTHFEIISDSWRLTDQGVIARNDLAKTSYDRRTVFDFVLRQRFFSSRPGVRGVGRMVKMTRTDGPQESPTPNAPTPVSITNWDEGVKLFSEELASAFDAGIARKQCSAQPEIPVVFIEPPQIVIDGLAYALSLDAAHYLWGLANRYGERISDREAVEGSEYLKITYSFRQRLKGIRDSLPAQVRTWIDTDRSGSKFRRPPK